MNKVIGAILIIAGLALGYIGFTKVSESTEAVKVLGVKLEASDESGKQQGYIFLGLGVVLFVGGIYTLNRPAK